MFKTAKNGILIETLDGEKLFQTVVKDDSRQTMSAIQELVMWISLINEDYENGKNAKKIGKAKNYPVGKKLVLDEFGGWVERTKEDELTIFHNGTTYRLLNKDLLEQIKDDMEAQKDKILKDGLGEEEKIFFLRGYKMNTEDFNDEITRIKAGIKKSIREAKSQA